MTFENKEYEISFALNECAAIMKDYVKKRKLNDLSESLLIYSHNFTQLHENFGHTPNVPNVPRFMDHNYGLYIEQIYEFVVERSATPQFVSLNESLQTNGGTDYNINTFMQLLKKHANDVRSKSVLDKISNRVAKICPVIDAYGCNIKAVNPEGADYVAKLYNTSSREIIFVTQFSNIIYNTKSGAWAEVQRKTKPHDFLLQGHGLLDITPMSKAKTIIDNAGIKFTDGLFRDNYRRNTINKLLQNSTIAK